ncbi:LOW QUALITY PROTEIN: hypothetical protein AAY473_009015 [Plecturocebus cupreus]
MGFHRVGQAGLELLTLGDPPALASQSAGITGMSHCTQPLVCIFIALAYLSICLFIFETESRSVTQAGDLTVLPRLGCSGMIMGHCNLDHPVLSNPPTSASGVAGTTGARYHAQLIFKLFRWDFAVLSQASLKLLGFQAIFPPSPPKMLELQMESHSFAQAREQWHNHCSLQSPPSGFKHFSCLASQVEYIALYPYSSVEPGDLTFTEETGFHHIAQAGLELLTSSDPPALASQSAEITSCLYIFANLFSLA